MMYDLSRTERQYRAINAETTIGALIAKRCACGKAAPAKQLGQHGKCVACQLAARVATLQAGDIDKLKHTVGAVQHRPKRTWGLRNYYCAGRGGASEESMRRMVAAGFISAGYESDEQAYFHATKAGCKLAGLDAAGVRRALEDES
jgi:hypothetical protein